MPVSRVIFPFTNEQIGGSHVSSFTLGTCLQRDHGVEVVVASPEGSLIERIARDRAFTVWPLPETPAFRHGLLSEARLLPSRMRLLENQPASTVVHANDLSALQSWGPATRLRGLALIYHDRAFNRMILPNLLVMGLAQRIICISGTVAQRLPNWLSRRAVLIDNPFELETWQDRAALRQSFATRHPQVARDGKIAPLIGFVGNFALRKRARFFLDMAVSVAARCPEAVFVVFGRAVDETQEALECYARQIGIGDRVVFAGFQLPVEDNIVILDVLAITAIDEPLGRTPLEALMLGVPYVATDDAGLGETARRFGGGLLVPREAAPESFADTVLEALHERDKADNAEARRVARETLTAARHTRRVLALYNEVTDQL